MPETVEFLVERLKSEGEKTADFFSALKDDQWQAVVYTEGETWSIRNVLAHFVTSEQAFLRLFANVQKGGMGAPENFDLDSYNAAQQEKTRAQSPQELLTQFRANRAAMVELVSSMSMDDLGKTGRHPFLGLTSLAEMIKMVYRHNQIHARDLRHLLNDHP
jgi:uncharacterized protein (TIGR03083 family)